jgi:hypothetical protein
MHVATGGEGYCPAYKEMDMKERLLVTLGATAALVLAGCTQAPDQAQVQRDVEKAQAEGQKKVADAQAKLDQVNAENRKDIVETRVDASAPANNPNTTPSATAEPGTPANASANKDVANAQDKAAKKAADAQYDVDKARAEAQYDVAVARCKAQTGSSEKSCKDSAKNAYDQQINQAKAKDNSANQNQRG